MRVDIWSDVICPWCYVGKRRFEAALAGFAHREEVEVVWRSFELDPSAPAEREGDPVEHLAAKYGMDRAQADAMVERVAAEAAAEGLQLRYHAVRRGSTFDAHRLLHLARTHSPAAQTALNERLMHGYFVESEPIGRRDALARLAVDAGLPAAEVEDVLAGGRFGAEVQEDEALAASLGANGVPLFVVDRAFGLSGAQPVEVFTSLLEKGWAAALAASPSPP